MLTNKSPGFTMSRRSIFAAGVLFIGVVILQLSPGKTQVVYAAPATFTVTNTSDSGAGSLRQAILSANTNGNPADQDIINFSINSDAPGDVVIEPLTALTISQSVLIDGYTQGDSEVNTNVWPEPFTGNLRTTINNSTAGSIQVTGNNVTLKGLVIYNRDETAPDANITVTGTSGFKLQGSYLSTENNGLLPAKTDTTYIDAGKSLVVSNSTGAQIGGSDPTERNIFGYCSNSCIEVTGSGTSDVTIQGNYIGLGSDGITSLDSSFNTGTVRQALVIEDGADDIKIGGTAAGQGNSVEHSAYGAILAQDSNNISILGNRILYNFSNHSGITFGGVTNSIIGSSGSGKNIISGNLTYALNIINSSVSNAPSNNLTIEGNNIGVMGDNTTAFPNGQSVIVAEDSQEVLISDNKIQNSAPNPSNVGGWHGVELYGNPQSVSILGNSIYNNKLRGISLYGTSTPDNLDTDTGPNGGLNYPGYTSIVENGGDTDVVFTMDVPAGDYRVEFFSNDVADPDYPGEGQTFIGFANVTSSGLGNQEFAHTLTGINYDNLSLTTTERNMDTASTYGATSEFGTTGEPYDPDVDLSIESEVANPDDIGITGSTAYVSVTITNNGPAAMDLNSLNDPSPSSDFLFMTLLPEELTYSSISGSGIACTDMGPGSASDISFNGQFQNHANHNVITCAYTGGSSILFSGQSQTFNISTTVMQPRILEMNIYSIVNATAFDPDYTDYQTAINSGDDVIDLLNDGNINNISSIFYNHTYNSDLAISKRILNPEDYATGNILDYEIRLINNGPDALDLSILDTPSPGSPNMFIDFLPASLTYSGITGTGIVCADSGPGSATMFGSVLANHSDHSIVTCAGTVASPILQSGEYVTYTLHAQVVDDSETTFYNHLFAQVGLGDPDGEAVGIVYSSGNDILDELAATDVNNYARASNVISNISVSQTLDNPGNVTPGANLNYTVKVTNNGPTSINATAFDGSGVNPLVTSLFISILPPNLTYVSQSNPDVTCTWLGPGSASLAGPLFTNHLDYSLLICGYSGASSLLGVGESIDTTLVVTANTVPSSFTSYVITFGSSADPDYNYLVNLFNLDLGDDDLLDRFLTSGTNNFVLAAYTAPASNNSDSNAGGLLDTTGQTAMLILPAVTLVGSLSLLAWNLKRRKKLKVQD